jgi:xanthine dehydrogenase accessory factor
MPTEKSIYAAVAALEAQNQPGALCIVTHSQGSTPRQAASKMLVYPDGQIAGTVGGGEMEQRVIEEALAAIADGETRRLAYTLNDPGRGDPGVCGGQVEVFVEPIQPRPTLLVIGGGHVGKAVVHLAHWLGFYVVLSDDRPEFCNPESVPGADVYLPIPIGELPQAVAITPWTYLVLTTRGSPLDQAGLPALLNTPAAYIGVIGSQRRWAVTRAKLAEAGVPDEQLARVRSPMGLELQAQTPEEIAVSILAEVLMLRDRGTGQPMDQGKV